MSSTTEQKQQPSPRNKGASSPRNDSDDIYYDEDIECLEEDCQKRGHPCVPEESQSATQDVEQPVQPKENLKGSDQPTQLQGGQGDQQNQKDQGQRALQQPQLQKKENQQASAQQKGNQQGSNGNQGRQRRQRNRRQRQQRLTPQGANKGGQSNQQENEPEQGQRAQQQPNNQQQKQSGQTTQNQPQGVKNQGQPRGRELGFNEGIQGPFGRFRGESVSTFTDKMPCSIKELFEHIPLEAMMIENWVRKRLVLVGDKQPLDKALQRLNRHKITSLPIINEESGNIKGILDSLDVVNYLCSVLDKEELAPARWDFNLQTTGQLLDMSQKNQKAFVISNNGTMYDGLLQLAKGVPRLMVFDGDCTLHQQEKEEQAILGLFTQSDIVRFLACNPYWLALAPTAQKTLQELGILKNSSEQVISVDQGIPAYQAFKKIADTNSTGIVVNDAKGRIVANLSAANIRGISRRNFQLLRRPLFEFLQRDRRRGWWTMPICIRESDTLEKCILQFGATKVHQMYVCDDNGKATNVVTLTDVLRQFVAQGINA